MDEEKNQDMEESGDNSALSDGLFEEQQSVPRLKQKIKELKR